MPFALLYFQIHENIVNILFSEKYKHNSDIGILVGISAIIIGIMHRYTIILSAMKKTEKIAKATLVALIVNIILSYLFIIKFGLIGGAWATILSTIVWLIMIRIYLTNEKVPLFPWELFKNVFLMIFIASIPVQIVLNFYNSLLSPMLTIFFCSFIYLIVYSILHIVVFRRSIF